MTLYDQKTVYPHNAAAISMFTSRVYGWMSIGLAFTAAIAFFIYRTGAYAALMPFWWVWGFATFGIALAINASIQRAKVGTVIALFLSYSGLQGIFFGTVLPAFAITFGGGIIWSAFLTASVVFLSAMLYGKYTKSDLTGLGRILRVALIGFVALTLLYFVLSFFISMTWANLAISYLGLIIFVGLTAYDAQTIRSFSLMADVNSTASYKLSLVMALKMYINVIMIFWYLLQIFSSSRRN